MKQNQYLFLLFALIVLTGCGGTQKKLTEYVNPFLGTATLWEPEDLGYTRKISHVHGVRKLIRVLPCPTQWCSSAPLHSFVAVRAINMRTL